MLTGVSARENVPSTKYDRGWPGWLAGSGVPPPSFDSVHDRVHSLACLQPGLIRPSLVSLRFLPLHGGGIRKSLRRARDSRIPLRISPRRPRATNLAEGGTGGARKRAGHVRFSCCSSLSRSSTFAREKGGRESREEIATELCVATVLCKCNEGRQR